MFIGRRQISKLEIFSFNFACEPAHKTSVSKVLLGLMIVYVFAIALTQIAVDTPAGNAYFSTLPQA